MAPVIICFTISCVAICGLAIYAWYLGDKEKRKKAEADAACEECGKDLFACKTCGCVFDTDFEARRCADWDRIMNHTKHTNHHHDDQT